MLYDASIILIRRFTCPAGCGGTLVSFGNMIWFVFGFGHGVQGPHANRSESWKRLKPISLKNRQTLAGLVNLQITTDNYKHEAVSELSMFRIWPSRHM